jgi:hypothetical protein
MGETHEMIQQWCREKFKAGSTFMLLVCDTYEYEQYPCGVNASDFWDQYRHHDGHNMQRIEGVFALTATGGTPIGRDRYPPDLETTLTLKLPKVRAAQGGRLVVEIDYKTGTLQIVKDKDR